MCTKRATRFELSRRLAGSSWGVSVTVLHTAILTLVDSTTEYCVFVWCRNAHTHLVDKSIYYALLIVTTCMHPTPTDNLIDLAGIQPTELSRQKAILSLACRAQKPEHLLHEKLVFPSFVHPRQLKSRHPFVPAALKLLNNLVHSG